MRTSFKKVFLQICWILGLFYLSKYLMRNKLQILCYHGFEIDDECSFRPKLFIKRKTFVSRLELLAKYNFNVLPLNIALDKLYRDELPENTVVITIDDGFYSTLSVASDLLNTFQFPATLYLTTYYVDKQAPIFRLVIQYMFWKTRKSEVNLGSCVWHKDKRSVGSLKSEEDCNSIMWECINYGEETCSELERVVICQQLGSLLDVDYQKICDCKPLSLLTVAEAKQLVQKNINLQLHTHRHRFPVEDQSLAAKEITDNREALKAIVDYPVDHFCYPSGIWNVKQHSWLEKLDVKSATTCEVGLNDANSSVYELKRFLDGENISEIEFKAELFGFMELIRCMKNTLSI